MMDAIPWNLRPFKAGRMKPHTVRKGPAGAWPKETGIEDP